MIKATISSRGRIAIPKAIRQRLKLKAGTQVSIDVQGESLVLKRLVKEYPDWRTMEGMFRGGPSLTAVLIEERAWEKAYDEARVETTAPPSAEGRERE